MTPLTIEQAREAVIEAAKEYHDSYSAWDTAQTTTMDDLCRSGAAIERLCSAVRRLREAEEREGK